MRPGPKIEHHHMKAMLYKILQAYGQSQNKPLYHKPKENSNKIPILPTMSEFGKKREHGFKGLGHTGQIQHS